MRNHASVVVSLLICRAGTCLAQDDPGPGPLAPAAAAPLETITVRSHHDADTEARRASTATKLVFGREELDRYGDTSLGEVLKRLPGITISGNPGRGGDIRMRGLGHGYTQVLLNGEPMPRGFSLDSLSPEQVERIEILRAPVAEHSARGIAGTINIVLREDFQRRANELRLSETLEQGRASSGLAAMRSDTVGRLGYNVDLNVFRRNQGSEVHTITTALDPASGRPLLDQSQFDAGRTTTEGVHLTSRLNWKLDRSDALNLQPFLMLSHGVDPGTSTLLQSLGASPPPFASADWRTGSDTKIARLFGNWQHQAADGARLQVRFGYGLAQSDNSTAQADFDAAGAPGHALFNDAAIRDRTLSNGGKYTRKLGPDDEAAAGWDLEYGTRSESATTVQDGVVQLAQFGSDIEASSLRVAGFAQDEHRFSPLWSGYAGLRWEGIRSQSAWTGTSYRNESAVLSPLLHSLWRLSEEDRDQLRLGLTRSYRPPSLNSLLGRPTLSTLFPASGPNSPTSPDRIGNPQLRPELAWGLDAAYEHYLGEDGTLAVSVFDRSIEDLMRSSTTLTTVSWSPVPRWVTQTGNVGHASTHGIELEAKFRPAELGFFDWPLQLRVNFSRFWSSVEQIVGPNNRLDQQPRMTANLGFEYRFNSVPLTLGGNDNWTPAYEVQQSDTQLYHQGPKQVLDCYALWRFSPRTRLRLAASNLLHRDYLTANAVLVPGQADQTAEVYNRSYMAWTLRLELKV